MWKEVKDWFTDILKCNCQAKLSRKETFTDKLNQNQKRLKLKFDNIEDVKFRNITLTDEANNYLEAVLIYIPSLVDKGIINDNILTPLLTPQSEDKLGLLEEEKNIKEISNKINVEDITEICEIETGINDILAGNALLLINHISCAVSISIQGWQERSVERPIIERTVRGPSEGFMENIEVNLGLMRRRIKNNDFKIETFTKGKYTQTQIKVAYIKGVANKKIVKEIKKECKVFRQGKL